MRRKSGDRAVVYTHRGFFVATIEFVGDYFYSEEDIGWTKGVNKFLFPYRIKFRIIKESEQPPRILFSTERNKREGSIEQAESDRRNSLHRRQR